MYNIDTRKRLCYNLFLIMNITSEQAVPTVIGEVLRSELNNSGIYDEELGREMSIVEAVSMLEQPLGVQAVFIDDDQYLSSESRSHNSQVARSNSRGFVDWGEQRVAIVSMRPTPAMLALREAITCGTMPAPTEVQRKHMPIHHFDAHGKTHDHQLGDPAHTPVKSHR